jgi:membrane complex biogenesis BtpA family protein
MNPRIRSAFGVDQLVIGMVHTQALPGAPRYDRAAGMGAIIRQARLEARMLVDAGFNALLYCNESDMPYQASIPIEGVAAMTEVVAECQRDIALPHGVNMLIDPCASIAIAHATGGRFTRSFLTGALVGDIGLVAPDGAAALRLRAQLGAEAIQLICNVTPGFSIALDTRSVPTQAAGAVFIGLADMVCVGGPAAGVEADLSTIEQVAARVPETPVIVGTGVAAENIAKLAAVADGFIVGTSIKRDRQTLNPVDPARAAAFIQSYRAAVAA